MLVLRPLTQPIFGELRLSKDVHTTLPSDMLLVSPRPCQNVAKSVECLCQRAFVGSISGCATTLAIVSEENDAESYGHYIESPLAQFWWGDNSEHMAADQLWRISQALERFEPGEILRVRWTQNGAKLYRAEFCSESEALAMLPQNNQD